MLTISLFLVILILLTNVSVDSHIHKAQRRQATMFVISFRLVTKQVNVLCKLAADYDA